MGPGGTLYLLSQKSRRLARIEGTLRIDEDIVSIRQYWKIPKEIESPEGLTFLGQNPVVASDQKKGSPNLFILEPLNDP